MSKEIKLIRRFVSKSCTLGELQIDGKVFSFTLEDVIREKKIKHQTCIPAGRYQIIINWSNRFQRNMPLLLNVPNFEGIRIHTGNTAANTSGCILIGYKVDEERISNTKKCFDEFYTWLKSTLEHEKVFITITNELHSV